MAKIFNFDRMVQVGMLALAIIGAVNFRGAFISGAIAGAEMTPWWAYLLVALGLAGVISQWVGRKSGPKIRELSVIERDFPTTNWGGALKRVMNQSYLNETVEIDGKEFINCKFESVTFLYQGKQDFRFSNSTIKAVEDGKVRVRLMSDNPVVGQLLHFCDELKLFGVADVVITRRADR